MSDLLDVSPADILGRWIVEKNIGTNPLLSEDWPVYIGGMPDASNVPNYVISVYDTGELTQGMQLSTGKHIVRYAYQIAVRGVNYSLAYKKCRELATAFETINRASIVVDNRIYMIHNVVRINLLSTGREIEQKDRWLLTTNGTASISKLF